MKEKIQKIFYVETKKRVLSSKFPIFKISDHQIQEIDQKKKILSLKSSKFRKITTKFSLKKKYHFFVILTNITKLNFHISN